MGRRIKIVVWAIAFAIFAMLSLQYVWLSLYYRQETARTKVNATAMLDKCLSMELYVSDVNRQQRILEDISGGDQKEWSGVDYDTRTISLHIAYPERKTITRVCKSDEEMAKFTGRDLSLYHFCGLDLARLDSCYTAELSRINISIPHYVAIIDRATGETVDSAEKGDGTGGYSLSTNPIELGIDDRHALVALFDDSGFVLFRQMKNAIIISAAIMLLLFGILFFLFRTIIYQKKLAQMREDYVNAMTHEIKNPIIYLKRVLGLIDSSGQSAHLAAANRKIEHLQLMLEKLLAVSKKQELAITPEKLELSELLSEMVSQYKADDETLDIVLEIEAADRAVMADRLHLGNAVINLIDNAIKYSEGAPVIRVRLYGSQGRLCVAVKDRGVGIPSEYHSRIFLKSFRVPEKRSLKRYGFGLGLSYVKMVVDAHRGSITLESAPGKGSEFTIHLDTV